MSRIPAPARRSGWSRLSIRAVAIALTAILAGATGLVGSSAAIAATPAAASAGTFTVTGTIPADARAGVTVRPVAWMSGSYGWEEPSTPVAVNAKTGIFTLKLRAGSSPYTLLFEAKQVPFLDSYLGGGLELPADDTPGAAVFSGAKGSTKALGQIKLVAAGVIEGVITDTKGVPIAGGHVSASRPSR